MELAMIIVFLSVIAIAFLSASIYNFIHGFITFFALGILLLFISFVGNKAGANILKFNEAISYTTAYIVFPYQQILSYFKISFLTDSTEWSFYIIPIGIWIISFVIASILRKIRRRRQSL